MFDEIFDQLFGLPKADYIIKTTFTDRQVAVRLAGDLSLYVAGCIVNVYPRDIVARGHNRTHITLRQGQYPTDHIALFFAKDQARPTGWGNTAIYCSQLSNGALAQHAQYRLGRTLTHRSVGLG